MDGQLDGGNHRVTRPGPVRPPAPWDRPVGWTRRLLSSAGFAAAWFVGSLLAGQSPGEAVAVALVLLPATFLLGLTIDLLTARRRH